METKDIKIYENTPLLSETELNLFAYALGGVIFDFYQKPENVQKYEEWKLRKGEKANGSDTRD